jgi:hypothetical protein
VASTWCRAGGTVVWCRQRDTNATTTPRAGSLERIAPRHQSSLGHQSSSTARDRSSIAQQSIAARLDGLRCCRLGLRAQQSECGGAAVRRWPGAAWCRLEFISRSLELENGALSGGVVSSTGATA